MGTDHSLRGTPLRERLAQDLHDPAEMSPLAAARRYDRTTVSSKNQHTREPGPGNLDEISEIDEPDLVWGCRRPGAFRWGGDPRLPRRARMRLLIQGDHLPDSRMAIALAQRIQGPLHPIVAQQRVVVQELEDIHHRLDRHPHSNRRICPRLRRQPHQTQGVEAALPLIDDRHLDAEEFRHTTRTEADL